MQLLSDVETGLDKDGKKMERLALVLVTQYLGDVIYYERLQTSVGECDLIAESIEPMTNKFPIVVEAKSRKEAAEVGIITKLKRLMEHAKTSFGLIVSNKGITGRARRELNKIIKEDNRFRVGVISSESIKNEILGSTLGIQEAVAALFLKTRLHEIVIE